MKHSEYWFDVIEFAELARSCGVCLYICCELCNIGCKYDISTRAPLAKLGLWDYRGKIWDYGITPCLKMVLQKSTLKLGLWISNPTKLGFSIHVNWDYGIMGLWDFTLFEIRIMGLNWF